MKQCTICNNKLFSSIAMNNRVNLDKYLVEHNNNTVCLNCKYILSLGYSTEEAKEMVNREIENKVTLSMK